MDPTFTDEELKKLIPAMEEKFTKREVEAAEKLGNAALWSIERLENGPRSVTLYRQHPITLAPQILKRAVEPHRHDYVELPFMLRGRSEHFVNGMRIELNAGDLLFIGENATHTVSALGENDYLVNILIRPAFFDKALETIVQRDTPLYPFFLNALLRREGASAFLYFDAAENRPVRNLTENLLLALMADEYDQNVLQSTFGLLLLHLRNGADHLRFAEKEDTLVWNVMRYIENHCADASLSALSKELYVDYHHLSKLILKRTGKTFKTLVQEKRLDRAEALLLHTELSVQAVAYAVGYSNVKFFYDLFEERYRMTPKAYRRLHAADGA